MALAASVLALGAALAVRDSIEPWPFGAVLLIGWGLLAHALNGLRVARALRLLLIVTLLALAVLVWSYAARQPRIQLSSVDVRSLPSTISPGVVELIVRNDGPVPANVVAFGAAHLGPLFRTPRALASGNVETQVSDRLDRADPLETGGTMVIPAGGTARIEVQIPPSQRSWFIARGEATVLVSARLRYRDRVFRRQRVFCQFATPPSGTWSSCPFLNQ
jgi:hypothetical protein